MNLIEAYKILEIPDDIPMKEIKQIYRDLVQIWHPDRYTHNERLQKKAQDKMKTLNEAYKYICLHFDADTGNSSYSEVNKRGNSDQTIVTCPQCDIKNRIPSSAIHRKVKCARCGNNLFQNENKGEIDSYWGQSVPSGAWYMLNGQQGIEIPTFFLRCIKSLRLCRSLDVILRKDINIERMIRNFKNHWRYQDYTTQYQVTEDEWQNIFKIVRSAKRI